MKKIILTLIISLFFINFSFANEEKNYCKFFNFLWETKDEKIFDKFKSCDKDEKIIDLFEKNWNYYYFVYEFNNEKWIDNLKLFFNDKIVYKQDLKNLPTAIISSWNIYVSKYWNHILSFIWNSDEVPENKKKENEKVMWYYLDDKKVLNIIDDYNLFQEKITEKLKNTDFKINYKKDELKIYNNFSNENFYLTEKQREKIDNFLKIFLENKENILKIDKIISKAELLKENFKNNLEKTEILNYIISELKIFKLKNS